MASMNNKDKPQEPAVSRRGFMKTSAVAGAAAVSLPVMTPGMEVSIAQITAAGRQIALLQNALLRQFKQPIAHACVQSGDNYVYGFVQDSILYGLYDDSNELKKKTQDPFFGLYKILWNTPEAQQIRRHQHSIEGWKDEPFYSDARMDGHAIGLKSEPDPIEAIEQIYNQIKYPDSCKERPKEKWENSPADKEPYYSHDTLMVLEAMKRRGPEEHGWREKAIRQRLATQEKKQK